MRSASFFPEPLLRTEEADFPAVKVPLTAGVSGASGVQHPDRLKLKAKYGVKGFLSALTYAKNPVCLSAGVCLACGETWWLSAAAFSADHIGGEPG